MPYRPIELSQAVPDSVRTVVAERIDPILCDVQMMLAHPKRPGEPGFNLSIVPSLCGVIGGLSRLFFRGVRNDKLSFGRVARRYPLNEEPTEAVRAPKEFERALYKTYRNNLVHSLGLVLVFDKKRKRWRRSSLRTLPKVVRQDTLPLSDQDLAELEQPSGRPAWLKPTLHRQSGVTRLSAEALYWGVRRLVRILAEEPRLQASCVGLLGHQRKRPQAPPPAQHVLSSAAPFVQFFSD